MPFISLSNGEPQRTLRARLRERRASLSASEATGAGEAASVWLTASPEFNHATHVAAYVAVRGEMDPLAVLETALDTGKTVYLPRIVEASRLLFEPWRADTPMRVNRFGILEPEATSGAVAPENLDLVIVPLLGFDATGARLGSGAGYYDRSFGFRQKTAGIPPCLAGYAYALQECPSIPIAPWDVPLDLVVTEQGVKRFRP